MDKLKQALGGVLGLMPDSAIKEVVDSVLDIAEKQIDKTETKIDDILIGNAIKVLRFIVECPDGDEENAK